MIDFPANPVKGQAFSPGTGSIYVYDGVAWNLAPVQLRTADERNRIINPTAQVSQENGNNPVTTSGYPADQWVFQASGITGQGVRGTAFVTPEGAGTHVNITATTAKASLAAGDYLRLTLPAEGLDVVDLQWGTAGARQVVLRFSAMCDTTGTYGFSINNDGSNRSYCGSFTIAAAGVWQTFSFAVPGDTTGTWLKDTGVGLKLNFTYAAGSTFVGVAGWQAGNFFAPPGCNNGAAVANSYLRIADVGAYIDLDKTGIAPPFVVPSYLDDLERCKRYWRQFSMNIMGYGTASGGMQVTHPLAPQMRTSPTMSVISAGAVTNANANVYSDTGRIIGEILPITVGNMAASNRIYGVNARLL